MLTTALAFAIGAFALCLALNLARLALGPTPVDRILALDTLYVNAVALLVLLGMAYGSKDHFEAALLIALFGFVGTVAAARYLIRGRIST